MTDWSVLPADVQVQVFRDHLADPQEIAQRLRGFEVASRWQAVHLILLLAGIVRWWQGIQAAGRRIRASRVSTSAEEDTP